MCKCRELTSHAHVSALSSCVTFSRVRTLLLVCSPENYQIDHLCSSSADKGLRALHAAQGFLKAGFTTLRTAGEADAHFPAFAVRKSIEAGMFMGPTIVGAGHYISVTGGGGDLNLLSPENQCCVHNDGLVCDGADAMVRAVRHETKNGADWIKVLATGKHFTCLCGCVRRLCVPEVS